MKIDKNTCRITFNCRRDVERRPSACYPSKGPRTFVRSTWHASDCQSRSIRGLVNRGWGQGQARSFARPWHTRLLLYCMTYVTSSTTHPSEVTDEVSRTRGWHGDIAARTPHDASYLSAQALLRFCRLTVQHEHDVPSVTAPRTDGCTSRQHGRRAWGSTGPDKDSPVICLSVLATNTQEHGK